MLICRVFRGQQTAYHGNRAQIKLNRSPTCRNARRRYGGIFDYEGKAERLTEVQRELEEPSVWDDRERAQSLGKERARLEQVVAGLDVLSTGLSDADELLGLAIEEDDSSTVDEVVSDLKSLEKRIAGLEFRRMFSDEADDSAMAFVEIQAGAGGTEAQDWAEMLVRMYLRWGESAWLRRPKLIEASPGEVAGHEERDGAASRETMFTDGCVPRPAYTGWCRKSPFDSGNRRHTSFASRLRCRRRWTTTIEIEINPADLQYRRLPCQRCRRPARQSHGVGGAYHAPADEHRRAVSERPLTAQEQGDRDEAAQGQALRARAPETQRAGEAEG